MSQRSKPLLNPKKKYLQIALNSTLEEAREIIWQLPISDRIIVEAGTPIIKRYGVDGIRKIRHWYASRIEGGGKILAAPASFSALIQDRLIEAGLEIEKSTERMSAREAVFPYVIADLKTMDRGATEVEIAAEGGASAAIALGNAPTETLNSFIASCEEAGIDAMLDMMNVEYPLSVLRQLKKIPPVVILHRGVDEESNKEKMLPLHEIRRIKGNYDIMISIAGGDTQREVQSAVFNDADIVVIWKSVYHSAADTAGLVEGFLREIK